MPLLVLVKGSTYLLNSPLDVLPIFDLIAYPSLYLSSEPSPKVPFIYIFIVSSAEVVSCFIIISAYSYLSVSITTLLGIPRRISTPSSDVQVIFKHPSATEQPCVDAGLPLYVVIFS